MIQVPSTITVAGTTLYHLASSAYGDASLWTVIAAANGLTDPWVDSITVLTIPRQGGRQASGGVLGG
ncbi:hypothetical protein [Roseomonas chloroacetimidivorans]|uniref:hypothetical protein n=1 Tax=Roseomonas chloroacetimidivorans TaxID=1766656 RepID=UPI003C74F7EB